MTAVIASQPQPGSKPRRKRTGTVLLRTLPGSSPLKRVWTGTKLGGLLAVIVTSLIVPGVGTSAVVWALVVVAGLAARVPRSALRRPPIWFGVFLLITAGTAFLGSGIVPFAVSVTLAFGLLALSVLVVWTTPLGTVAPAVAILASPLRRFRLPVDEWSFACALTIRALPLMQDEFRVLVAARRLRRRAAARRRSPKAALVDLVELSTALLSVSLRRAADVGSAIELRGGVPTIAPDRPRLRGSDLGALVAVAASVVAMILLAVLGA